MTKGFYKTAYSRKFKPGAGLPVVSTDLDSVRAYQWEMHFFGLPAELQVAQQDLTLAAKQVSPVGMASEDIEVRRVNDTLYYPGIVKAEEIVVTFDNLYLRKTSEVLWEWFKATYDPLTGEMTKHSAPGGAAQSTFKAHKAEIVMLDNTSVPHSTIEVYGIYPKSCKFAEFNYSTNDFHTIEVTFRFDLMDHYKE